MKAEELRIGNYVRYLGGDTTVNVVSNGFISTLKSGAIAVGQADPIPLTEKWLLSFGFEWIDESFLYADERHCISERIGSFTFEPFCTTDSDCWISINHVHQLQNLYFALTGEELVIKDGI